MKFKFVLISFVSVFITCNQNLSACDIDGHSGFLKNNDLKISLGNKSVGGLSEAQFNQVMDKMELLFSNLVAASGAKLVIERRWSDETVNAYALQKTPGVDTITMFGGLARHPEVTQDAMALVACHELGHHLAGAPSKNSPNNWAANEGQADYWGAMKCLRKYFEGDNQALALKKLTIPTIVTTKCNSQYSNLEEQLICQRTAMAGASLAKLLNIVSKDKTAASYSTPDQSIVKTTFNDHPQSQCRLDTFLQASLCDHTIAESDSKTDPNIGVCSVNNGDQIGNRPLCWYKP